jgi:hypothetical protein
MKDKSTIQDPPPEPEEGKFKAAAKRRENYSLTRDLKAKDNNEAIARRLVKDKKNKVEDKP